jgi:hypothetical protein
MLSLLFLPVRLALTLVCGVLWLAFALVRLVLTLVGTILILPVLLLLAAFGLLVAGLTFLVKLTIVALFVWILVRLFVRPAGAMF